MSEDRHVVSHSHHDDGSETIQFRSDTSFFTKRQIARRYEKQGKEVTLYSDGRLEIRPKTVASSSMEKMR